MTEASSDRAFRAFLILTLIAVPLALADAAILPGYYIKLLVLQLGVFALFANVVLSHPKRLTTSPLLLPIAMVIALALLTSIWAVNRVEATVQIAQRLTLACFFLVLLQRMTSQNVPSIIAAVCVTAGVVSLIGLGQYIGVDILLDLPSGGMPSATFGYRNYAAMFLIQAIPLTLYLLVRADDRHRLAWSLNLALLLAFLVATRTRAAWAALILALTIATIVAAGNLRRTQPQLTRQIAGIIPHLGLAMVIALIIGFTVAPDMGGLGYEFNSREKAELSDAVTSLLKPGADKDRVTMWANTLPMISDYPHGVGPGNWQYVYPAYDGGDVASKSGSPRRPHNDYIWMIAESGILGGAAYAGLFAFAFVLGLRGIRSGDPVVSLLALAASTSLIAICGHAFFSFPSERVASSTLTWLTLAVIAVCANPVTRPSPLSGRLFLAGTGAMATASLLSFNAVRFDRANAVAFAQSQAGNWPATEQATTEALRHGPFDPQIFLMRGVAKHHRGDYAGAAADQRSCLQYHPYFVNALNNLGMSLNALGRHNEALVPLKRVRALQPDHLESHVNLAAAYRGKAAYSSAVEAYRSALLLNPKDPTELRLEIAATLETAGQYEEALRELATILRQDPERVSAHYRTAVVNQRQGDLPAALEALDRVATLTEDYVPAHYTRGQVLTALGDTTAAVAAYENFLSRWQGNPEAARVVTLQMEALR